MIHLMMTEPMLRELLAELAQKGGSLTLQLRESPHALHWSGPSEGERWQVCRALVSRGLATTSNINEETGLETVTITTLGRKALENPSASLPLPEGAMSAAPDPGVSMDSRMRDEHGNYYGGNR